MTPTKERDGIKSAHVRLKNDLILMPIDRIRLLPNIALIYEGKASRYSIGSISLIVRSVRCMFMSTASNPRGHSYHGKKGQEGKNHGI